MIQLLDLVDRGAFVKGVDLVDWNQLPGCTAISTRAVYEAFGKERSIGDAALREALRAVQADHPRTVIGLSEKVLFRSKRDRRRAIVLHLDNARLFAAGGDPKPQDPLVTKRAAVRPNTWTTLVLEYEALSKVEQYNVDLRWTEPELRDVLGARVRGYLVRTSQWEEVARGRAPSADDLIAMVFQSPVEWGRKTRPVHVPLVTLSRRRPRWLIELAREAAKAAHAAHRNVVNLADITACLESFGKKRIADTVAEFSSQCPQLNELIAAFSRQAEEYSTAELVSTIERRVCQALTPSIVGVMGAPRPVEVAAFLFQIGFLSARRNLEGEEYEHLTYVDKPDLLRARTNIDDGVRWEIHPVFRQALQMREAAGRSLRVVPGDKRGR